MAGTVSRARNSVQSPPRPGLPPERYSVCHGIRLTESRAWLSVWVMDFPTTRRELDGLTDDDRLALLDEYGDDILLAGNMLNEVSQATEQGAEFLRLETLIRRSERRSQLAGHWLGQLWLRVWRRAS